MSSGLEYVGLSRIEGPLIVVEKVRDVGFDEMVEVTGPAGETRIGQVLDISEKHAVVQVLEGTTGLSNASTRVRVLGRPQQPAAGVRAGSAGVRRAGPCH